MKTKIRIEKQIKRMSHECWNAKKTEDNNNNNNNNDKH